MHLLYLVTTCATASVIGYAAYLNFRGADSVKAVADRVRVPRSWMVRLGTVLSCGALGLLAGFGVPPLGAAAGVGLVAYFVCAVGAHLRAGDRRIGGPVFFLLLSVAALATNLADHAHWATR